MTREQALALAGELVSGDRDLTYGSPTDTHERIALAWSAILGIDIEASDCVAMMAAVKLVRAAKNPTHVDSWIDLAGYAAIGAEVSGK